MENLMTEHNVSNFSACVHALKQTDLKQSLYDEAALMMDRAVVCLHGQEHRLRRNQEGTVFRKSVFLDYEKNVLPQTLEETLAPYLEAGKADLVELGYRIMMNLTADFTGIDRPERSAEETAELLRLLMEFSLAPALGQSLEADIEPKKIRIRKAMAEFEVQFLKPSVERRRTLLSRHAAAEIGDKELPNDVLTALLKGQQKLQMTDEELLKEGIFFSLAGAHTTIHSLSHAIHELLTWLEKHPEDIETLRDDPFFIQKCVFESLRLHPSSPVAKRRALCPVALENEVDAAQGDQVVVDMRTANREAEIFGDDADQFNPHRQTPNGYFPYGLSMGHGMHACLGRNLAIGLIAKEGADVASHQFGTVPLIVNALVERGIQKDSDQAAKKDETITRITWAYYPVIFKPEEALI
jgi:cytochrome P450